MVEGTTLAVLPPVRTHCAQLRQWAQDTFLRTNMFFKTAYDELLLLVVGVFLFPFNLGDGMASAGKDGIKRGSLR